jgi:hypothetical protein
MYKIVEYIYGLGFRYCVGTASSLDHAIAWANEHWRACDTAEDVLVEDLGGAVYYRASDAFSQLSHNSIDWVSEGF